MPYSEIFREFSGTAESHPSKPAVFFRQNNQYKSLTYGELYNCSIKLGFFLREKGAIETNNIVILLGSQPEWPIAFMGIHSIGAVAVPIDINLTSRDIRQLILHCQAKIILCSEKLYNGVYESFKAAKGIEIFAIDTPEFSKQLEKYPEKIESEEKPLPSDKTAAIFYTSGTTDLPKGVVLSQKNILSNAGSLKKLNVVGEQDTFISFLPLHHTYSFMVTCLFPLLNGAQISYPASLTSEDLLSCLKETKVSVLTGVPQIFLLFHQKIKAKLKELPLPAKLIVGFLIESCWILRKSTGINLSKRILHKMHQPFGDNLRYMVTGGARLEPNVMLDFFKWGFTVIEGYGLTETSPVATFNPPAKARIGSAGKALPDVQIRIVNPDNKGIGEVAIKGPNVMLGYYRLAEQTKKVIRDEWFFSGDLGYMDKDGYLFLLGRNDEMIVLSSGKKVNPEEIEKYYSSPYIKEICIFAEKTSGMVESATQLTAVIVPNEEYFRSKGLVNIEDKIKWEVDNLSQKLAGYRRIKGLVLSKDVLPRTRLGKLMRHKVEAMYSQKLASSLKREQTVEDAEDLMLQPSESYRKLLEFLSNRLKRKVNLDDHLELDLGFDSLGRIELFLELKEFFNIDIPESAMVDFFFAYTIRELLHKVKPYLPQAELKQIKRDESFWEKILSQQPQEKTLSMIRLNPRLPDKVLTLFFGAFFRALFGVFFRFEVRGRENLPDKGPYIIYSNHISYLDGFIVFASLPFKTAINLYFLGLTAYFTHPLIVKLNRPCRLIPIDATFDLVKDIQSCAYVLKHSKILCYFPEGQRAPAPEGIPFKKGIGILAKELNVPLVPVYIEGAFQVWPRFAKFPRPAKIRVRIGEKVTCSDLLTEEAVERDIYEVIAEGLRKKLLSLQ